MHITHDKGDVAEAAVILDLTKKGFVVFKPLTQNTYADVVILRDNRLETVQIKHVSATNGVLHIPLRKQSSNTKGVRETYKYNQTPLTWVAVYCPEPEQILYIPRSSWSDNSVSISVRVSPPKNNQAKNVRLATNFVNI